MDIKDLTDQERLILGLRFRLKHIRLALAEVEAGQTPNGFEFSGGDTEAEMLAELHRLEAEVQTMLANNDSDESARLN